MSIEKMREEFEAWECDSDHGPQTDPVWLMYDAKTNTYPLDKIQARWFTWQASRAALASNEGKVVAQRLREYNHNAHHVNPMSDAFHALIDEAAEAISNGSNNCALTEDILDAAYWDFDSRIKGYAPYGVPCGNQAHAFKTAVFAAIEAAGVRVKP